MTRNQKIERFLRYPSITYERIGKRFGLTRERVRQIRTELFMKGGTITSRKKHKYKNEPVADCLKRDISYEQICEVFGISEEKLLKIRNFYIARGSHFPKKKQTSKRSTILRMLKEDTGPRYGRCKRIAHKLGISHQYVLQSRYDAKKRGITQ